MTFKAIMQAQGCLQCNITRLQIKHNQLIPKRLLLNKT